MNEIEERLSRALHERAAGYHPTLPTGVADLPVAGDNEGVRESRRWVILAGTGLATAAVVVGVWMVGSSTPSSRPSGPTSPGKSVTPAPDVQINVAPPPDVSHGVLIRGSGLNGTLAVNAAGCVYLDSTTPGASSSPVATDLVWPAGTTVGRDTSGHVVILDSDDAVVGREGERIDVGGGGDSINTLRVPLVCRASTLDTVFTIEHPLPPIEATRTAE